MNPPLITKAEVENIVRDSPRLAEIVEVIIGNVIEGDRETAAELMRKGFAIAYLDGVIRGAMILAEAEK